MDERDYFEQREQAARRLAEAAKDPASRHIHLTMASAYHRRATEAGNDDSKPRPALRLA